MTEENFGKALRADRFALGFTQQEFCSELSKFAKTVVSQQTLARWEKGAIPHRSNRVNLFEFLKQSFEVRGFKSEVLSFEFPESNKNKNTVKELLKTLDNQASEIAKLKNVIRTLIS